MLFLYIILYPLLIHPDVEMKKKQKKHRFWFKTAFKSAQLDVTKSNTPGTQSSKVWALKLCLVAQFVKGIDNFFRFNFKESLDVQGIRMQLCGAIRSVNKSAVPPMILTFVGSQNGSDGWQSILPTTFSSARRCDRLQQKRLTLSSHFIHLPLADGEKVWHHPSSVSQPSGLLIFPDWCLPATAAALSLCDCLTWEFFFFFLHGRCLCQSK